MAEKSPFGKLTSGPEFLFALRVSDPVHKFSLAATAKLGLILQYKVKPGLLKPMEI